MFAQRWFGARRLAAHVRAASGSCGSGLGADPPCAPCPPRAPPPCRAPATSAPPGVREVCCPPRRPPPPPCPPANCTLTCGNVTRKSDDAPRPERTLRTSGGLDCVAWRNRCARHTRQLDYEREVASRSKESSACGLPAAPYALGGERVMARATDGHLYAISGSDAQTPMHCSSTGESPPPRPVTLEQTNPKCHIGDNHLDPCAHRPRVFREIDRKSTASQHKGSPAPAEGCASDRHEAGIGVGARRAGDFGWCKNPPSFPGAPQRCRPLTITERLRAQPRPPGQGGARRLHTTVVAGTTAEGIQELVRLKEGLQEAGRGRVVLGDCVPQPVRPKCLEGKLDMCVPPGTSRVRLRLYLDGADCSPDSKTKTSGTRNERPCLNCQNQIVTSACKVNESWLSIKSIQKKLSGGPDAHVASSSNGGKCPSQHTLPPPRPRPACADAPRRPACPRPSCPPAPSAPATSEPPCAPKRCKSSSTPFIQSLVTGPSW